MPKRKSTVSPQNKELLGVSDAMTWATRQRAIMALFLALTVLGIGFAIWWKQGGGRKESNTGSPIIGLDIKKQPLCLSDDECTDGFYCSSSGYCVPKEMEPQLDQQPVLGRGRGGEGVNVVRASVEERGQD